MTSQTKKLISNLKEEIEEKIKCEICKEREAEITYAPNGMMGYIHGNKQEICKECYNKIKRSSEWYQEGRQEMKQEILKEINSYLKLLKTLKPIKYDLDFTLLQFKELKSKIKQKRKNENKPN